MNHSTIQLTIDKEPEQETVQQLARHDLVVVTKLPSVVLGKEARSSELGSEGLFGLIEEDDSVMAVPHEGGQKLSVNGEEVTGHRKLAVGDHIACGGYEYGYYVQHERVGLSFTSRFLAYLAKGSAGLFLFLEILAMVALPVMFARATMWNSRVASQRINNKLDAMRKQVAKIEVNTVVARAILGELENELDDRARYIRQNGFQLRRSQRRRMEAELGRMEEIMEYLASGRPIPADIVRKPSLDEAVRRIIGEEGVARP